MKFALWEHASTAKTHSFQDRPCYVPVPPIQLSLAGPCDLTALRYISVGFPITVLHGMGTVPYGPTMQREQLLLFIARFCLLVLRQWFYIFKIRHDQDLNRTHGVLRSITSRKRDVHVKPLRLPTRSWFLYGSAQKNVTACSTSAGQ